ncbi:MAG: hypothetical protein LLF76_07430 [Planctomycetaceae bacterium]|nr:hypothetical protein [Planctomycetaceae bacterium]
MHLTKEPQKYYRGDPWNIVEYGFDPARQRLSESIFTVSNEHMGVRGYFEEGYGGDHLLGSYFNHLYDYLEFSQDQVFKGMIQKGGAMINAVDWLYLRITLDGEALDLAKAKFREFRRTLNMREFTYTRSFIWQTHSGKELKITFIRFASMDSTEMGCQRICLEPLNFSGPAEIICGLDGNTKYEIGSGWNQTQATGAAESAAGTNFWKEVKKETAGRWCSLLVQTQGTGFQLFSSFCLQTDQPFTPEAIHRDKFIGTRLTLSLKEKEVCRIDKIVLNTWAKNSDTSANWAAGKSLIQQHGSITFDVALKRHTDFMASFWSDLGVDIEGDDQMLQGMRFSALSCYQSYHGQNPHLNPLCKGLTGEVYFGWAFWDTEIYCHRFHLFVNPTAAKNLLMYRYNNLHYALRRAEALDCRGARFPFASISGYEDSGTWQHVDLEHHISGAIGYAIWQYDMITKDKDFLYREGIEMLLQICRFYASAGDYSPANGDFGLYGVMGPDEFHMMVNHNFYTNYLAKKVFSFTLDVLEQMKSETPDRYEDAIRKTGLDPQEPVQWKDMAAKMRINQDAKTKIFEQHQGYFDLPHVDIMALPPEQIPIYKNWAYIRIFRKNMIKQPDVLNHMFFFSEDFTPEEKKANYEFYEKRTIHESSLSPSLHSILAWELGKTDEALQFLTCAARLDLDNYNRNTEQGQHATSAAGVWAAFVCGCGGMRSDGDTLSFSPRIPAQWKSYRFRIHYRNSFFEVVVTQDRILFQVLKGGPLEVRVYGKTLQIGPQETHIPLRG